MPPPIPVHPTPQFSPPLPHDPTIWFNVAAADLPRRGVAVSKRSSNPYRRRRPLPTIWFAVASAAPHDAAAADLAPRKSCRRKPTIPTHHSTTGPLHRRPTPPQLPHLTCGSLESSGVVLSVYNFTDFDKQKLSDHKKPTRKRTC